MNKTKKEIHRWFKNYRCDYSQDECCLAAENCAVDLGHDEWLDDPDHVVWEIALEYFDEND